MKTTTYLRFSLLIPFLIWGICFLLMMAIGSASMDQFVPELPDDISFGIAVFFTSYLIGIVFWIFPYLLLSLILFFWSFIGRASTALKVFALSPLAMTLLTVATVIILDLGASGGMDPDFFSFIVFVVALVLVWGYICVGIGFGIYKLLRRKQLIQDEERLEATLQPV